MDLPVREDAVESAWLVVNGILGDVTRKTMLYGSAAVTYIGEISNPDFVAEMADMTATSAGIVNQR